ncbi:MAG: CinA family nicotinamide mononucleotide deamidase-related protein [Chloroflexota bacterium]|nr:CinA family nicotinamide mononucleotide deamidase-related protein [Chloroflexota bacterium]
MQAEVIAIGTELLLGVTVDTNSAYLAQQLATIGVPVRRVTLVRDDLPEMVSTIKAASERSELVICSGGLGPTGDDLTREAIAAALDKPLEFHQVLLDDIAARFAAYKRTMSPSNRQQAYVPRGAFIIRNPRGTAPAFVAQRDGRLVAALPGVPQELQFLTEHGLLPYLRDEHGLRDVIVVREVRVSGLPESVAGERIADMMNLDNPVVGITAKRGQHTIRMAATATSHEEAEALIAPLLARIEERFGDHLLGSETLEERVGRMLKEQGTALVVREGVVEAPVFRLLSSVSGGREALLRGSAIVRRWSPDEGALSEASLVEAAREAFQSTFQAAQGSIVLIVVPAPEGADTDYRAVHFLLTDGARQEYLTRGFDLRIAVGYDLVAAAALELLRRWFQTGHDQ